MEENFNVANDVEKNDTSSAKNETPEDTEELTEVEEDGVDSKDTAEFDDGASEDSSEEKIDKTEVKKKQSKEENHKYAEMRKQKELEREENLKKDSYKKGLMEGIGGVNPYTNEKIEDDDDIEIYRNMREIEKRGGDPVEDFAKYTKIFKKEAQQKEEEARKAEEEKSQSATKSFNEFVKNHPDVDTRKLLSDEIFRAFSESSINRGEPFGETYEKWIAISTLINSQVEEKARKIAAKTVASAGSLTGTQNEVKKSFLTMPDEEFISFKQKSGL